MWKHNSVISRSRHPNSTFSFAYAHEPDFNLQDTHANPITTEFVDTYAYSAGVDIKDAIAEA